MRRRIEDGDDQGRPAILPVGILSVQRRLDRYRTWYNEHRPHAPPGGRTPQEAWQRIELPESIPIRATVPDEIAMQVQRRSYHGDPALLMTKTWANGKEAA